MDEQVYRLPNLVLSFQLTIKSDRDEVEGAADRIMSLSKRSHAFRPALMIYIARCWRLYRTRSSTAIVKIRVRL